MRLIYPILLIFGFLALPARADDLPLLDVTVEQAREVQAGLANLDGYQKVVKDGDRESAVLQYYKFSPGALMVIARDKHAIDDAMKPYEDARMRLLREFGTDGKIAPNSDAEAKFMEKYREVLDTHIKVPLGRIRTSELKMSDQLIRPSVISALLPILDDDGK